MVAIAFPMMPSPKKPTSISTSLLAVASPPPSYAPAVMPSLLSPASLCVCATQQPRGYTCACAQPPAAQTLSPPCQSSISLHFFVFYSFLSLSLSPNRIGSLLCARSMELERRAAVDGALGGRDEATARRSHPPVSQQTPGLGLDAWWPGGSTCTTHAAPGPPNKLALGSGGQSRLRCGRQPAALLCRRWPWACCCFDSCRRNAASRFYGF